MSIVIVQHTEDTHTEHALCHIGVSHREVGLTDRLQQTHTQTDIEYTIDTSSDDPIASHLTAAF